MKKIFVFTLFFVFIFSTGSIVSAKSYTDYPCNLTFDIPENWVFLPRENSKTIILYNGKNDREIIFVTITPVPSLQVDPQFNTMNNFDDETLYRGMAKEIEKDKLADPSTEVLSSKIIKIINNKAFFYMLRTKSNGTFYTSITAVTLMSGTRYDMFSIFENKEGSLNVENIMPVFLDVLKSLRPAY